MASEEPEDYSKLPLDVKLSHKVWRARLMGYEEATKTFRRIDDEASSEYSKYTGLVKKFVVDSNQMAQEKGVEATLAFVECAAAATKISGDVVAGIVTKCLGARPKTKEGSVQVCLMFVEIEQQEVVLEEIMKGFTNKQPKIVAASIQVITRILQEFGAKVLSLKILMKAVPSLFEHSDKNVRAEAKNLAIELFKWVGAAIKPTLEKSLKPVQLKELEEEWGKVAGTPSVPTRFLRSQQQQQAQAVPAAASGGGDGGGDEGVAVAAASVEVIDPYDLADPEDFLGKMPKDFFEKIADTKWKERKEMLETVLPTAQSIKIQPGDYGEVLKALKKVITKDTNVLVVALAGNVITGLAKGLRGSFQSYASPCLAGIFEKFKEKKLNVVTSLREAADAVYLTTSLPNIQEEIAESLNSKNPSVKAETLLFMCRCFQQCVPSMVPKPLLKTLCPLIVQKLDDTNPAVREAGMECLGTLMRVVGDRPLNSYVEGVDKSKMAKIQEHREAVELKIQTGVIPSPMKGQAARPPTPSAPPTSTSEAAPPKTGGPKKKTPAGQKKKAAGAATEAAADESPPAKKPPAKTAKKAAEAKPSKKAAPTSGGGAKGGKGKGKGAAGGVGEAPDPPEPNIANEEVEDKANAVLPAGLLTQLEDPKWKDRLEACGKFKEFVEGQSPADMQSLLYCKVLARKPGWKDSNFQVMNGKFAVVKALAEKAKVFGKKSTACVMPGLVEKLGDIKVKGTAGETLKVIAERMTLNYVGQQVMKLSFEQKSPKVHSESLDWLGQAVKEFGFLLTIKPFIDHIKKGLSATNPAVRTAAISLLGVIYLYLGAQLRMFFEEEKPALLQQIDAAFEKVSAESAPAPTRGPNVGGDEEEEEEEAASGGGGGAGGGAQAAVSLADLMPKVDISGQIKPELIKELGDKNWKIRGEALQKVIEILKAAKFIDPHLADLPAALKARLGDANKNLIMTTLSIVSTIASSMGSSCSRHAKAFVPGIISTFSDSKPQVRVAAVACLDTWHTELGVVPMVEQEFFTNALATENPNLRAELLKWLEEKLPTAGKLPSEFSSIVPPLFSCLEDRSGDVRKKAQAALPHIMAHVGYDNMCRQCGKLGQASKQSIKPLLDKHKAVAPPPKAKAPAKAAQESPPTKEAGPSGKKAKGAKAKVEVVEVEEVEVVEKPAEKKSSTKKPAKGASAKGKTGGKKGGAEDPGAPLVLVPHGKEGRHKDEDKSKTLKWNFAQPRREYVDQLKDQMLPCVSSTIYAQLFHDDFKKHIVALESLTKCLSGDAPPLKDAAIGALDLLLHWVTLRFFDTNTTVNLKCLDFLKVLFNMLVTDNYRMSDYEANAFLPYLVNKVGDAKEPVRKGVRALFREICSFYPPTKLFVFVSDGLKSKNARQRAECLEELGVLIQNNGMVVCGPQPQKTLPAVAAQISNRDNAVRSAALNTMVTVYGNVGEAVYKYTSQLSDKDTSYLEERIKRSGKKPLPPSVATPASSTPAASAKDQDQVEKKKEEDLKKSADSAPASTEPEPEQPVPTVPQEAPPPVVPEPKRPGTVAGPFKLNYDFTRMHERMNARADRTHSIRKDLSKEQAAMLDQPPVAMPKLVSKYMNPSFPVNLSPTRMASTSAAINYIISQIAGDDYNTSSKAIRQIESTMVNPSQRPAVTSHVDRLIGTVLMQLRMKFSTPLASTDDKEVLTQVMELGKLLTSCLFTLFSEPSLASQVSKDSLMELLKDIMTSLVDENTLKLEEAPQLLRTFNCLVLKICDNGEKTAVFGALIESLLKSIHSDGTATKTTDMIMKCLWKLTRQIPQLADSLNLDQVLLEMHMFMVGYTRIVPSPAKDDIPFRTIKTVLFHLTNTMGAKIANHLTLIKDPNNSKVTSYIRKTLAKNKVSMGSVSSSSTSASTSASPSTSSTSSSSSKGATATTSERDRRRGKQETVTKTLSHLPPGSSSLLSTIFQKIGDHTNTKEGLMDLYQFQQTHPTFDLESVLGDQTQFYRDYISRGLQHIKDGADTDPGSSNGVKLEREKLEQMKKNVSGTFNISMEEMTSGVRSTPSPTKDVQESENKPLNQPPVKKILPAPKTRSLRPPSSGGGAGASAPTVDLADLRRRLDKLKGISSSSSC